MMIPLLELADPPTVDRLSRLQFLLADGIGGYSLTTPAQTRNSSGQGLLAVALEPARQVLMLARVDEALLLDAGARAELNTHFYQGATLPDGFERITHLAAHPFPTTRYQVGERVLERTVFTLPGHAAVGLRYTLLEGAGTRLELRPMLACRDVDRRAKANDRLEPAIASMGTVSVLHPYAAMPPLFWGSSSGDWLEPPGHWYYRVRYPEDEAAGRPAEEDLWNPGRVVVALEAGRPVTVVAGLEPGPAAEPEAFWAAALEARAGRADEAGALGADPVGRALAWAADAWLVRRGDDQAIVTSYPGGEAPLEEVLMALPGLTLATGRAREARAVLARLAPRVWAEPAGAESMGWFLYALDRYLAVTGDLSLAEALWPALKQHLEPWHWSRPLTPDAAQARRDAVWANAWTAASILADAFDAPSTAREWGDRATHLRLMYRGEPSLVAPGDAPRTDAQVLAVSLPYPLLSGPVGWDATSRLLDHPGRLEQAPLWLRGQAVTALVSQRMCGAAEARRWLEPAIAYLLGAGLGQLPTQPERGGSSLSGLAVAELTRAYGVVLELERAEA